MREGSRFCIVSDLDHTMVDHHSAPGYESLLAFNWLWNSKFRHDSYLVFSTGRSLTSYQSLREEAPLLTPDLLICSVGTEIYAATSSGLELDSEWIAKLDEFWNRDQIVSIVKEQFSALKPQDDSEQRPHKVSYHLQDREEAADKYIQRLRDALDKGGLKVKVVYSGGIDVDVLPECASKGLALQFLQKRWQAAGVCPKIQVNGDSGNDAELFEAPDVYGCIVSNAMDELVQWADANPNPNVLRATQRCAAGIIETMHHFKLVPDDDTLPDQARAHQALIKLVNFRTDWLNAKISKSDDELEKGLSVLHSDFKMGKMISVSSMSKSDFKAKAESDYGSGKDDSQLMWIDKVQSELKGDTWVINYLSCCMKGSKREPAVDSTAEVVVLPEGTFIKSIMQL